jgi:hypothetical protein
VDVVAAHHRAAPPTQQLCAVLQLLDDEKEDGGLGVVVLQQLLQVEIVRGGRTERSTSTNSAVEFMFDSAGAVGRALEVPEKPWA